MGIVNSLGLHIPARAIVSSSQIKQEPSIMSAIKLISFPFVSKINVLSSNVPHNVDDNNILAILSDMIRKIRILKFQKGL